MDLRADQDAEPPMKPHETCSCGAEMLVTAASVALRERERASFRQAHAGCRTSYPCVPPWHHRPLADPSQIHLGRIAPPYAYV